MDTIPTSANWFSQNKDTLELILIIFGIIGGIYAFIAWTPKVVQFFKKGNNEKTEKEKHLEKTLEIIVASHEVTKQNLIKKETEFEFIKNQGANEQTQKLETEITYIRELLLLQEQETEQYKKEKQELETRLASQTDKNVLKKKALDAIDKNNFEKGRQYLKESAKGSISDTAETFYEIAKTYLLELKYFDALEYFELAAKISPNNTTYLNEAGSNSNNLGLYDKAKNYYETAITIEKEQNGEEAKFLGTLYNNLGEAYYSKGEYDKAMEYYNKALTIDKKYHGEEHPDIATRYNNLGLAYNNKGEYDKAIEYYFKALTIDKKYYGEEHPEIAIRYNNLGLAYNNKGEYDKAIDYYYKALLIFKKYYREEHPSIARDYNNLGAVYYAKEEYETALNYFKLALPMCIRFLGEDHPHTKVTKEWLRLTKEKLKK